MWIKSSTFVAAGVLLISYSAACNADDVQAARAVVTGPENRVYEFHQNLLQLLSAHLGTDDPAATAVSCDFPALPPMEFNCDKLRRNREELTTVFYTFFRDHVRLEALIMSWNKLQTQNFDEEVKIAFDMDYLTSECGGYTVCVSAPFCAGPPKRCDKVQGPPCTTCVPPPP